MHLAGIAIGGDLLLIGRIVFPPCHRFVAFLDELADEERENADLSTVCKAFA